MLRFCMLDQIYQILHDLLKLQWISKYMQKMNIIAEIVFEKLKFKKSCYMIGGEDFGL